MASKFSPGFAIGMCVAVLSAVFPSPGLAVSDKELFEQKCSQCHSLNRILAKSKTAKEWEEKVNRMAAKTNAKEWLLKPGRISEEEAARIAKYLAETRLVKGPKEYHRGERTKNKFEVNNEAQRAEDLDESANLELLHVPVITLPAKIFADKPFTVEVRVGKKHHPMLEEHRLKYISLYRGDELVGKVELKPGDRPKAEFNITISKDTDLKAVTECTSHRLWESVAAAKVAFY